MLVSRINPYSGYPSYNKNQTIPAVKVNQTDSVSFKGTYLSGLPRIITAANAVLRKMGGKVLEVHVPKLITTCKASQGTFNGAEHLCLCFDKEGQSLRYRISLNDNNQVSLLSELTKEKLPSRDAYFAESALDLDESSNVELQTLLRALKSNKNIYESSGFPVTSSLRRPEPKQLPLLFA